MTDQNSGGGGRTQIIAPKAQTGPTLVPTLQVIEGPRVGSLHRFKPTEEDSVTVGRTTEAQFVLAHPTLSRVHAKFSWIQMGGGFHMMVEDQQSTNGVTVNGTKIDSAWLNEGDRIGLGDAMLRYQLLSPNELAERDRLIAKATKAETDPLTGLGTRHYMDEMVPKLFAECESRAIPISLCILDLDHFKRVNDTLGHQTGDEVLKAAAGVIARQIRASDIGIRYGGEEMMIFLPGSNVMGARLVAERIRCAIAAYNTRDFAENLRMSVSIGVAQRHPNETLSELTRRADEALYRAKHGGRNRVEADLSTGLPVAS